MRARPPEVARPDNPPLGIAFLIAAAMLIPISDAFAKMLAAELSAVVVLWLRYVSQTVLLLPFALFSHGARLFRVREPHTQILRGLLIGVTAFCFFSSIQRIPLADAVAVFFVFPFIVTALSPFALGERVGVWRWSAVCIGFVGALVIVRPGFAVIDVGTLYALAAGTCFSFFVIVTRRLAGGEPALVTTIWTGAVVAVVASVLLPFAWTPPEFRHWGPIAGMGILGCVFSLLIVMAYDRASASQLAPFGYVEIAAAAVVGWIAFGDFPDAITWLGIAIIVASGLVIVWREGRARA